MQSKILITGDFDIPERYQSTQLIQLRSPRNNDDIIHHLKGVSQYIVGGPEYVDEEIMRQAPSLKHVIVMGTGTNSFIDLKAAKKHQIKVDNTPGINAGAVAEFALGTIIFNLGNSFYSREGLLRGAWYQKPHKTLAETKIGLIGLGDIGTKLVEKIRTLSPTSEISYFSRTRKLSSEHTYNLSYKEPKELMQECDTIALCVTYNKASHHIINSELLAHANSELSIFNFSNPWTVDPKALKEYLISEKIRFAFFDGYYDEWINNKGQKHDKYGLLGLGSDKFIATSHIAAQTHHTISNILDIAFIKTTEFQHTIGEINTPDNTP
jgi:lactate dehydrogenase-like 2-hydroxyacid dehydrogenase